MRLREPIPSPRVLRAAPTSHAGVRAFTLIEMLVAVAILGSVIAIGSYGYALYARHWTARRDHFEVAASEYRRLDLVLRAVRATLPWMVRDASGRPGFYFLGRDEGMTLVTASPVFAGEGTAVIRLFREPAGEGRWNLVYEEAPLAGVALRQAGQLLPFSHRMVVLTGLPRIEFSYYGWASIDAHDRAVESGAQAQWYDAYDGLATQLHPDRIALRFGAQEALLFMPARAYTALQRYAEQV